MKKFHKIKLVFGLGNYGNKYYNTPHNFGRDFLEDIVQKNLIISEKNYQIAIYKNIYLAIANKFMNESGIVLKEIIHKLKIKNLTEVLIVHDEADLPFLWIKLTFNKYSSMHKGVESVYKYCGKNIWRLRIGIQGEQRKKANDLILKKLKGKELTLWNQAKKQNVRLIEILNNKFIEKVSFHKLFLLQ
ncbi:MAG: peptidyl-tRNA hydrolase [Candidatus Parcubacteria bacterium]|nr:MAG: peptidyl-tRNA hydrolase [Candidatus Parcubacteria bacterium]